MNVSRHTQSSRAWFAAAVRLLSSRTMVPIPACGPSRSGTQCSGPGHGPACTSAGKRPLIAGFNAYADAEPDRNEIQRWSVRFDDANLAGVVRSGFVVVEADSIEAEEEVLRLEPRLVFDAPCRERRAGRGRAWILSDPRGLFVERRQASHRGNSRAIDAKGPGTYLIVPPSRHRTGHVVSWVPGREPWSCSTIPLSGALAQLFEPHNVAGRVRRSVRSGGPAAVGAGVSTRVERLRQSSTRFALLWRGEGKRKGDLSASGYDFSVAEFLLRRRVAPEDVAAALRCRPGCHRTDDEYLLRTVQAAQRGGR